MSINIPAFFKRWVGHTAPYRLAAELKKSISARNQVDLRVASLEPRRPQRGNVLLSYILDAFYLKPDDPVMLKHTHYWETRRIAQSWLDLGYAVDAIHWKNNSFLPRKHYDFFIDVRTNLERIAPLLNSDCVKIMHIETAHWLTHMTAQHQRLLDLQRRRNTVIRPRKIVFPNWAIENADCATILGNKFTQNSFAYAGKPFYHVPVSAPALYPWPENKDFEACRRNFLWFGSGGLVHKGLDLVLEAFSRMRGYHLTVCGPVKDEKDFEREYTRELYDTPGIRTVGWVDVNSPDFIEIANNCLGIIYPSCSEGGGAGVITCLHAGLIPVVSYETSIDIRDDMGIVLSNCSVKEIQRSAQRLSDLPREVLESMARRSWEYARARHTREKFAAVYSDVAGQLIAAYK